MGSDYWGMLAKINRPALVVAAQSPFVSGYQRMQREIPGARIEIFEGAGHALFVDDPERFNSLLDAFLTSMPRSTPSSR
jgi:pimeloyl-ACP methyl ester carboxylesterase